MLLGTIGFGGVRVQVLEAAEARASTAAILEMHSIPAAASRDLLPLLSI